MSGSVSSAVADREALVLAEEAAAAADDAGVSTAIDTEEAAALAAVASLAAFRAGAQGVPFVELDVAAMIGAREADVSTEVAARAAADVVLSDNIAAENTAMAAYITTESAARGSADLSIQTALDNAAATRVSDDGTMSDAIVSLDNKFGYSGAPAVGAGADLLLSADGSVVRMNYKTVSGVVLLELHKGA